MKKIRKRIFLQDVLILALTTFGGPQVHLAMFIDKLVKKRAYLSEEELLELQALCAILPGPTSTQTITALGYKIGGSLFAYLTLLVWISPAIFVMTLAAFGMTHLRNREIIRFIQPVGIAMIIHSGIIMGQKVIKSYDGVFIMIVSAVLTIVFESPWICPLVLLIGGIFSSFNYKDFEPQPKHKMIVPWANLLLFVLVFVFFATLGHFTDYRPFRLFENFYRNGSLVFGGGQVLAPVLYTEFVEFKHLIKEDDFLTGMSLSQTLPGPVFAFTSYLGTLIMKGNGFWQQMLGSVAGAAIYLPGTFLIFFVYRIWGQLKQYRGIRASLMGINAASIGLTLAGAFTFLIPIVQKANYTSLVIIVVTFLILKTNKVTPFFLFLLALIMGVLI